MNSALQEVFLNIYRENHWGSPESVSGTGSTLESTEALRAALPEAFRKLGIRSVLDLPCGDFGWFSRMNLEEIACTGMDIVPELVERNVAQFAKTRPEVGFLTGDLLSSPLPAADLVFCRDCLVHLPLELAQEALRRMGSGSFRYAALTTFTGGHHGNSDTGTGGWRPLNLEKAPFLLPSPLVLINEDCGECGGVYRDKSIGIWPVGALADAALRWPEGLRARA